jgi:Pyridoxamine 5'-phosphate oxidase
MADSETHSWLEELSLDECLRFLRGTDLGRVAFMDGDFPVVLPVNYRLTDGAGGEWWLTLRTRSGNVIDQAPLHVAFEVDGMDAVAHRGWSVLVRGDLRHVVPTAGTTNIGDSEPWIDDGRDSWLIVEPTLVSGRRLHPAPLAWAFHMRAYL